MANIDKAKNEYGTYLFKEFIEPNARADGRIIVYLHDQYDNPDIFNDFADQLKHFDYYAIALPGDNLYESEQVYKNSYNYTCKYVRDLILSFNAKSINLIAHGSASTIALFLVNILSTKINKLCLINPFCSKASIETIKWISTLPRNLLDMQKVVQRMYHRNDNLIFYNQENSIPVVSRMKNVYEHWDDISNFVENIVTIKALDEFRIYEENLSCPLLLILGEQDEWIKPQESLLAFSNYNNSIRVQMPNTKHYPLHDQKDATINTIMKFFIRDSGLYDETRLPNKYVYKYLDDDWKQYYRSSFADKLNARDLEEYNKKMSEYEKSASSISFKNEEYTDYINEYANQQTKSLDMIYNQVQQQYNQTKAWEDEYKRQTQKTIQLDYSTPANTIIINNQGYEVYHDGRGHGYYREPNGDWKKIKTKV